MIDLEMVLKIGTAGMALAALILSLVNFFMGRGRDRRDSFLKIHERQLDPDIQAGRRLLYKSFEGNANPDFEAMRQNDPDGYAKINRSMAMLDVMGFYAEQKYIDEKLVLAEWGHPLANISPYARAFIAHRTNGDKRFWSHATTLIEKSCAAHPDVVARRLSAAPGINPDL